jgi:DNA-binding transcriptional LysR family regulator
MRTFCDLVESGSFSHAAESNSITQSAVSQQLSRLQKRISRQLIRRGAGTIFLTEAGRAYYEASVDIVRRYDKMLLEIESFTMEQEARSPGT